MRTYKTLNGVINAIKRDTARALEEKVSKDVKAILDDYIDLEVYKKYTPVQYERTFDIRNSVRIAPVVINDQVSLKIYIEDEQLHSGKGLYSTSKNNVTVDKVFGFLEDGFTISRPKSEAWSSTINELNNTDVIIKGLIQYLKDKGYRII